MTPSDLAQPNMWRQFGAFAAAMVIAVAWITRLIRGV